MSNATGPSDGAPGGLRILVADDNEDVCSSLAALLQMEGHIVEVANDGEHAIRLAHTMQPQVALLDIGMPRISGIDVAYAIRGSEWSQTTVIIAITGWSVTEVDKRGDRRVFDAYLTKPVEFDSLLSLLQSMAAGAFRPRSE